MTTPTDDELLALAKKVPQGKWIAVRCAYSHKPDGFRIESGDDVFHPRAVPDNDGILHIWIEFAAYVEEYIAAANPAAIIALIERHRAEVEELRQRVGFIESKVDIEDMPDHYAWAVNELTARKAYSKAECATLIAEQRAEAERLTRERDEARVELAKANNEFGSETFAWPDLWRRIAEMKQRLGDDYRRAESAESALAAERKRVKKLMAHICWRCAEDWPTDKEVHSDGIDRKGEYHPERKWLDSEGRICYGAGYVKCPARAALAGKDAQVTNDQRLSQPE